MVYSLDQTSIHVLYEISEDVSGLSALNCTHLESTLLDGNLKKFLRFLFDKRVTLTCFEVYIRRERAKNTAGSQRYAASTNGRSPLLGGGSPTRTIHGEFHIASIGKDQLRPMVFAAFSR